MTMLRSSWRWALLACLVGVFALAAWVRVPSLHAGAAPSGPTSFSPGTCGEGQPYAEFEEGDYPRVSLELARTDAEWETGLMNRSQLGQNSGMLFVFPYITRLGFWMHDTLIPLSIAWMDGKGRIVDIQDMQAISDDVHYPADVYVYALEVNLGWFSANGVTIGQQALLCLGNG